MIRVTAAMADSVKAENGVNSVILPYFGETSKDNWLLTYPMCQLAVSKQVEEDEEKKEAVLDVLMAIFSEEGQKAVAAGTSVLSYNKEVHIEARDSLQHECTAVHHDASGVRDFHYFGSDGSYSGNPEKPDEAAKEG